MRRMVGHAPFEWGPLCKRKQTKKLMKHRLTVITIGQPIEEKGSRMGEKVDKRNNNRQVELP